MAHVDQSRNEQEGGEESQGPSRAPAKDPVEREERDDPYCVLIVHQAKQHVNEQNREQTQVDPTGRLATL